MSWTIDQEDDIAVTTLVHTTPLYIYIYIYIFVYIYIYIYIYIEREREREREREHNKWMAFIFFKVYCIINLPGMCCLANGGLTFIMRVHDKTSYYTLLFIYYLYI